MAVEDDILTGTRMLVLGMPNVGKSTLLNTLRRYSLRMEEKERKKKKAQAPPSDEPSPATKSRTSKSGTTEYQWEKGPQYIAKKVAKTGAQPGITRSISSLILLSREPLVYIYDTPGIFIPHLPDPETMLKLSLAGSVKDGLVPAVTVADYLLYRINLLGEAGWKSYKKWCPHPTNDVLEWLRGIARRTGKLARVKQGEQTRTTAAFTTADDLEDEDFQSLQSAEQEDLDAAAQWAIARYREGGWGKWGLDEVKEDGLIKDREDREGWGESLRQARLRIRREGKESREAKNSGDGDA